MTVPATPPDGQTIFTYLAGAVATIVWLVRLEGKTNQNEKDIMRLEKSLSEVVSSRIDTDKEMVEALNKLTIKMERMIERMEHMNKKVNHLEAREMAPILEEYYKKHSP